MSGLTRDGDFLYDPTSGRLVGYVDRSGIERSMAATPPARAPVWSWSTWPGGASTSGLTNSTWQFQIAVPAKAYAAQVAFFNPLAGTPTIDKVSVTPSSTYVLDEDATGGTQVPFTFGGGGSASVTLTTRPSANECAIDLSDWVDVSPVDRTDVVGGLNILHFKSYCALGGQPYTDILGASGYAGNTAAGYIRRASTCSGDKIANAFYSGSNAGLCLLMAIKLRVLGRALRLGVIGDSIAAGTTGAGTGIVSTFAEQACHIANNQAIASGAVLPRFWSSMNFGWGGQTMAQIQQRLAAVLTANPGLDAMLIPVWSPNSAPTTQDGANAVMSKFLGMVHQCVTAGVEPIPFTPTPYNALSAPADLYRKQLIRAARTVSAENGFLLAEIAAVTGDGGSVEQWLSGLSEDGLHPTEMAKALYMAPAVARVLPYAIPF